MNQQLQALRHLISQHFDRNELFNLAFDLQIDIEEARNEQKSELTRYLIEACRRRGQLTDLLRLCREQRPHVAWPEVLKEDTAYHAPVSQNLPPIRTILIKALTGGVRGFAAGVALAVLVEVGLALVSGAVDLFLFALAALLGGIAGIPLGIIIGFIEIDEQNEWRIMVLFGGVGGLIVGTLAGITLSTLLGLISPAEFVLVLLFGIGIGVCAASVIWATQGLVPYLPFLSTAAAPSGEGYPEQKASRLYTVISSLLAGAIIGAFIGATFGLVYDVVLGQDPFFGTITSSIGLAPSITGSLTLTVSGIIGGSLFLAAYRALARQMVRPIVGISDVKWRVLVLLGVPVLTLMVVGIRPLGYILLTQGSQKPYVTREYVGRIVSDEGRPIGGADVTLILEGIPIEASTDADGVYRFDLTTTAESLSGKIVVRSRLYGTHESDISIDPDTTILGDVHITPIAPPREELP